MKNILIPIVITFLANYGLAQNKIKVSEKYENLGGAKNNAFSVMIYETASKDVEKGWKQEMKSMKAKVTMKKEMFGDDATLSAMGDNTFDIYAITKENEKEKSVELIVAIDLGGAFLSSDQHSSEAKAIKEVMHKFAVETTKESIQAILKDEEKNLKSFEKEQDNLVKDKEKLETSIINWEKSIEQSKKNIEQAKKDIEQNIKNQGDKKKEIEEQKKLVQEVEAKEQAVN